MIICVIEIFIELLIAYTFYIAFRYFIELKVNKMRSLYLELTFFNKLLIIWIHTVIVVNSLSAICRLFQTPLLGLLIKHEKDGTFDLLKLLCVNFFIPLSDYSTAASLMALFTYQALKFRRVSAPSITTVNEILAGSSSLHS